MGNNASELGRTLAELRRMGRVEKIDAARLQALRTMAGSLDDNPQNAALWRQYRELLSEVLADDGKANDALADALATIRGSTAVGDSPAG